MAVFLVVVGILCYLSAGASFLLAPTSVQEIFGAIAGTCGTVAFAGAGIISKLEDVRAAVVALHSKAPDEAEKESHQPWA